MDQICCIGLIIVLMSSITFLLKSEICQLARYLRPIPRSGIVIGIAMRISPTGRRYRVRKRVRRVPPVLSRSWQVGDGVKSFRSYSLSPLWWRNRRIRGVKARRRPLVAAPSLVRRIPIVYCPMDSMSQIGGGKDDPLVVPGDDWINVTALLKHCYDMDTGHGSTVQLPWRQLKKTKQIRKLLCNLIVTDCCIVSEGIQWKEIIIIALVLQLQL